jgi:deoxyribodipyrimidine photo-lyase
MNVTERITLWNKHPLNSKGECVFYWAQTGLRLKGNPALCFAIETANQSNLPLNVFFGLRNDLPHANRRHFQFLKEGLLEFKQRLEDLGGNFHIEKVSSVDEIAAKANTAACVIADGGYLRTQRLWRKQLSEKLSMSFIEIEGDVLCPVRVLRSEKAAFARQLRKKMFELLPFFSQTCPIRELKNKTQLIEQGPEDVIRLFDRLKLDDSVNEAHFVGGEDEADQWLTQFLSQKLHLYKKLRSDPSLDYQSNLSPYLHFGFISPIYIVNTVLKYFPLAEENVQAFFNELLVWRELARNFVLFEENYDNWKNLPAWAVRTLDNHLIDARDVIYDLAELEHARTHDSYWNSAQKEMVLTGKMHNTMRMYWAKKVIEWTKDGKQLILVNLS